MSDNPETTGRIVQMEGTAHIRTGFGPTACEPEPVPEPEPDDEE